MDGGITKSISQPGIKKDIYAARTPIRRQGVGGITNQNYDQPGLKEDHNNNEGGNNHTINLDLRKITQQQWWE